MTDSHEPSDGDGILTSGREHLPLTDRVTLLLNERLQIQTHRDKPIVDGLRHYHAEIHEANSLSGLISNLSYLLDRAGNIEMYAADFEARYHRPLTRELSDIECRLLAFKRGGTAEVSRWKKQAVEAKLDELTAMTQAMGGYPELDEK